MLYLLATSIYNVYFHPLSKFPGPKLYASSYFFYMLKWLQWDHASFVLETHKKYGPIVRVAPNQLSFSEGESAWPAIYGKQNGKQVSDKDRTWYPPQLPKTAPALLFVSMSELHSTEVWGNPGQSAVGSCSHSCSSRLHFLTRKSTQCSNDIHQRFRKSINPAFAPSLLRDQEPIVQQYLDLMVSQLKQQSQSGKNQVDMNAWFNFLAFVSLKHKHDELSHADDHRRTS